jgi:hypothetical protein
MEPEHLREWSELRDKARSMLRSGLPQSCKDQRIVQVIEMPSFHPWTSWELYEQPRPRGPKSGVVVQAIWKADLDADKFRDPVTRLRHPRIVQPTITASVTAVAEDFLILTANELRELSLPICPGDCPLVLDGTGFEMTAGNCFAVVTYRWTESPPDSWLPLHRWATRWIAGLRSITSTSVVDDS